MEPTSTTRAGSQDEFIRAWESRHERLYTHWTPGPPENQIQLAFQRHWRLFSSILREAWPESTWRGRAALEVGCGRGTMSMFFASAGFDCTLLDISAAVLDRARAAFEANGLPARFVPGDALALPLPDASIDVVYSIGLLEHFEDIERLLSEQVRVLRPGGVFLGYVVPERPDNVQRDWRWVNDLLKVYARRDGAPAARKEEVYRSDRPAGPYVDVLRRFGLEGVKVSGVYPLPMLSPSIEFPFTLNPPEAERVLVERFERLLAEREAASGQDGWLCDEAYGQAFLIWGRRACSGS